MLMFCCPERFFVKDIYLDRFFSPVFVILISAAVVFHLSFSLTIWMFLGWRVCRWKVSLMMARVFVGLQEQICFFAWWSLLFPFLFCLQWFKPQCPVWSVTLLFVWRGFISGLRCSAWICLIVWLPTHLIVLPDCVSVGRPTECPVTNQQSGGVACPQQRSACSENSSHCSCKPHTDCWVLISWSSLFYFAFIIYYSFWGTLFEYLHIYSEHLTV